MPAPLNLTTPSDRVIVVTREFDAPRATVWRSMTEPDLIKRWLFGPPGWTMTRCDNNARAGGTFRWTWRGPDGEEFSMFGAYREVTPPHTSANGSAGGRIVRTESFDMGCPAQSGEQLATLTLTDLPGRAGRTRLTITLEYPSKEARDSAIASGMEHGMAAGYDRLDTLLAGGLAHAS